MPGNEQVLFLVDAGEVLIRTVGGASTLSPYLVAASPLPERVVRETVRTTLFVASEDTPQLRADVAARLQIPVEVLDRYRSPEVQWYPGAVDALAQMHALGVRPVIVTNASIWDAEHIARLEEVASRYEIAVHPSYQLGVAKPDARLFHLLARRYAVEPKNMVLVDDKWDYIAGAADMGVRGLWFSTREPPATSDLRAQVRTASTWPRALPIVRDLATTGFRHRKPRDHDVRAVVAVFNSHGEIAIEHGILDPPDTFHLPGGGVQPDEQPRDAVVREAAEELGILVVLHDFEYVVKIPPTLDRRAQIVFVFIGTTDATDLKPWPGELDDACWATPDEALSVLYPGPYGDAALLRQLPQGARRVRHGERTR